MALRSTTGRRARAAPSSGFTLLELIVVMAILAIGTALVIPSLHGFAAGRRAGDCAEEITALCQWARTQAIVRGKAYRLNLDPNANTFWLTEVEDDGTVQAPGEEFGRVFSAPDGVRLSWDAVPQQDGTYVQFLPNGRCDSATITITDPNGKMTQVACYSPTEMFHVVTDQERQQG